MKFKRPPFRKACTFFLERDKSGKITGINSKKAHVEIISITNNYNTGKQITEIISAFEIELSDFVYAKKYADPNTVLENTGARGGST